MISMSLPFFPSSGWREVYVAGDASLGASIMVLAWFLIFFGVLLYVESGGFVGPVGIVLAGLFLLYISLHALGELGDPVGEYLRSRGYAGWYVLRMSYMTPAYSSPRDAYLVVAFDRNSGQEEFVLIKEGTHVYRRDL